MSTSSRAWTISLRTERGSQQGCFTEGSGFAQLGRQPTRLPISCYATSSGAILRGYIRPGQACVTAVSGATSRTERIPSVRNRGVTFAIALIVASVFAALSVTKPTIGRQAGEANAQKGSAQSAPVRVDGWGRPVTQALKDHKPGPAPRRDLSGVWDPAPGPGEGIQQFGAKAMPEDGKPEHRLPYTPLGLQTLNANKPSNGIRSVLPADTNDPVVYCDPQGMPREDLYELRTTQILQTPLKVVILYEFGRVWRVVWTDGRAVPKNPEPRWFGYSTGKWQDDYTLLVQTSGTDERTWIDRAGRPHSGDLRIEERFHRLDQDTLELTVTIDDPKMYTKPWVALDKFHFKLQPDSFDVREMICSPSEFSEYNKIIGIPASGKDSR